MDYISLNTAQNVRIEYDLAPFTSRLIAGLIDIFIAYMIPTIYTITSTSLGSQNYIASSVLFALFSLYPFLAETFFNGSTVGKSFLNIKVAKIDATPLTVQDCLLRWFFKFLDIFISLGSVAALCYFSSTYKQRLGDIIAKTIVVTASPVRKVSLSNILKIADTSNHIVKYPRVTQLMEQDLVFIKNILDNKKKYTPKIYTQIMEKISEKVIADLNLDINPKENKEIFLRNLIIDYVVLTR